MILLLLSISIMESGFVYHIFIIKCGDKPIDRYKPEEKKVIILVLEAAGIVVQGDVTESIGKIPRVSLILFFKALSRPKLMSLMKLY
ncbi:hypothetical protein TorRG33x02_296250 [Trema orientale]|uniref:Uncharacterized protein n=1 Tax=Trema orientale TaxID=63057 RepID=A0A2P5C661_TREOI|nr:hypothetical protein TorRG33x02_296250 [Trema orientale]